MSAHGKIGSLVAARRRRRDRVDEGVTDDEFSAWLGDAYERYGLDYVAALFADAADDDPTMVRLDRRRFVTRERFDELVRWEGEGGALLPSGEIV